MVIVADYASDLLIALAVVGFISGLTGYPLALVALLSAWSCFVYTVLADEEPQ